MKKRILIILVILVTAVGLTYGGYLYSNRKSEILAKEQVTYLIDADYESIYGSLAKSTKELYKDESEFTEKFSNGILIEEIEKTELRSVGSTSAGKVYTFELIRKDDPLKAYTVVVTVTKNPISMKVKDILFQEEDFAIQTQTE